MTWLDEIENEATLALEGDEDIGEYMDKLRMARVIRAQSKILEVCHSIDWEVIVDELEMGETKQKIIRIWNLMNKLHLDAEKLLDKSG